jgi:hypothetical protein
MVEQKVSDSTIGVALFICFVFNNNLSFSTNYKPVQNIKGHIKCTHLNTLL